MKINWQSFLIYAAIVAVSGLLLVVGTITTSSIGIFSPSGAVDASVVRGTPQPIRSDEYLRGSPRDLGLLQNHGDKRSLTPFEVSTQTSGSTPASRIGRLVHGFAEPEKTVGFAVLANAPVATQFAWLLNADSILLFIFMPLMLVLLGVRLGIAIVGTAIVWLSPAVQWWSGNPVALLAPAAASGALILLSAYVLRVPSPTRVRYLCAVFLAVAGGLRVPVLAVGYTPWSIPVFLFFGFVIFGGVLGSDLARIRKALVLGVSSVTAIISGGLLIWANSAVFRTMAATVYPGTRRSEGLATIPIWSGSIAGDLAGRGLELVASNQSELAMGLLILIPISAAVVLVRVLKRRRMDLTSSALLGGILICGVLMSWVLVHWPAFLLTMNPLVLVAPNRAAQILGPLAVVLFLLAIEAFPTVGRQRFQRGVLLIGLALALMLSVRGGTTFAQSYMPTLAQRDVLLLSAALVAAAAFPFFTRRKTLALVPLLLFSLYAVKDVNPVQFGTGALTNSEIATAIKTSTASASGRWGTDDLKTDALVLANGVPQLSGQQFGGPDLNTWHKIDPSGAQMNAWNRGASYVTFSWDGGSTPSIGNPGADIITISVDPCSPAMAKVDLRWIVSSKPLEKSCLTAAGEYPWLGSMRYLYHVNSAPA